MPDSAKLASNEQGASASAVNRAGALAQGGSDPRVRQIMADYAAGKISSTDATNALRSIQSSGAAQNDAQMAAYNSQKASLEQQKAELNDRIKKGPSAYGSSYETNQAQYMGDAVKLGQLDKQLGDLDSQIKQYQASAPSQADYTQGNLNSFYTDAETGGKLASEFVQNDALTKGLFGQGGLQDYNQEQYKSLSSLLDEDRNALMGRDGTYGLQDSDLAAYGQGSDQIARLFGAQESGLAQQLADRGLGAAPSGIAAQNFSNLYGNKNEQLANLQMQISQARINTAKELAQSRTTADLSRQAQSGQLALGLGQLGQSAVASQYNRQLQGAGMANNQANTAAGLQQNQYQLQQGVNDNQFAQWQSEQGPSLGDIFAGIAGSAASGFGTAVGKGVGTATGKAIIG